MADPSATVLLVLHALRVKGLTDASTVDELWGTSDAEGDLRRLGADGLVQHRDGRVSGWSLTPDGHARHAALVAQELDAAGARGAVEAAYRRFLALNPSLLEVCTGWQLRAGATGQVANDHTDVGYDRGVVERLGRLHADALPVLDDLASALDRYGRYRSRLTGALAKVRSGDADWFTKPLLDSYHTVWFELHEDLLSTLGLQRGSEGLTEEH